MAAQVADAAQPRRRLGERAHGGEDGRELADLVEVGVETDQPLARADPQAVLGALDARAHLREQVAQRVAGLRGARRATPAPSPSRRSRSQRRGTARRWRGRAPRRGRARAAGRGGRATWRRRGRRCRRRRPRRARAASRRSCRCAASRARARRGGAGARPSSKRAAESSSALTNWLEAEASIVTSPPRTAPVPLTVKGRVRRPSSSISTPSASSASITPPMGRTRARGSPSNRTSPSASAATGGAKRMTLPASPQSTYAGPWSGPGVTRTSPVPSRPSMPVPSEASALPMSRLSRARSAPDTVDGPSESAARTSARLVSDFEPGTATTASTGEVACGAGHGCSSDPTNRRVVGARSHVAPARLQAGGGSRRAAA